ncbi:competence protein TfoX [Janthinobacterium lividum]|uniref:Competence protein TfoX n=1 Tax=Janthinobacterium lividum TaxID=29581 RepID=A0A1S1U701_9BURK|nr:TfoX/Sxy family protein [Janthinobacterium lividum]OHV95948.1 competence protein TfoX [Janthinobacterium lividum]
MASQQGTVDFLLDQLAGAGSVNAKKMFGEYGLYCDGKMFAIVADDQLFIKPTDAGRAWISAQGTLQEAPPYPQAKPYFLIDGGLWDERDWLSQLARRTADALPLPKPKPPPKPRKPASSS